MSNSHEPQPSISSSSSSSSHQHVDPPVTTKELNQILQSFANQIFASLAAQLPSVSPGSAASVAAATAQPSNTVQSTGLTSPTISLPSKVKISPPSNFTGNSNETNVDSWLFEMEQYLDTTGVPDHLRINVVRNYLKQGALQWWFSQSKLPTCPTTWEQFTIALKLRFQPIESARVARSQLRVITQAKSSVTEYASKFQSLLNRIPDMAEADQIEYFINGLRSQIQRDVVIQDPKTLQDAMIKAQKLDVLLQPSRFSHVDGFPSSSSSHSNASDFRPIFPSSSSSSAVATPMELGNLNTAAEYEETPAEETDAALDQEYARYLQEGDEYEPEQTTTEAEDEVDSKVQLQAMHQRRTIPSSFPPLTREEFDRCMEQRLCLRCKRPGHVSRECDQPPRLVPRANLSRSRLPPRFGYSNFRRGATLSRRSFE